MENLIERAEFWSKHYFAKNQGESDPHPFIYTKDWYLMYQDKKVLEIGPGEGRQFDVLMFYTKDYSIADISREVINQEKFSSCVNNYLIDDWEYNLNEEYDTICFWYVIHHIKRSESIMFFEFLKRFLKKDGFLHFNYPYKVNGASDNIDGDGIKTTKWSSELIHECLEFLNFEYIEDIDEENNSVIITVSAEPNHISSK